MNKTSPEAAQPITILHIEDDEKIRKAFARVVRMVGREFKLISVASGEDALQALQEDPNFDVIISDWNIDGFVSAAAVYEWVKANHPALTKKYIFISTDDRAEKLCQTEGITFLKKPVTPSVICDAMKTILAQEAA